MHCRVCEYKGQSTKCVSEEERKTSDGPFVYAHGSERSIQQSGAFTHGFSPPTAILKIGTINAAAISSAYRSASWENRHKRRAGVRHRPNRFAARRQ